MDIKEIQTGNEEKFTRREFLKAGLFTVLGTLLAIKLAKFKETLDHFKGLIIYQFLEPRSGRALSPENLNLNIEHERISINVSSQESPFDLSERLEEDYSIEGYVFFGKRNERRQDVETVVFAHGYPPGSIDEQGNYIGGMWDNYPYTIPLLKHLTDHGYNVVIFSTRGHPPTHVDRQNTPIDLVTYGHMESLDTFRVIRHLQRRLGLKKEDTYAFGWSGGTTSLIYAQRRLQQMGGNYGIKAMYLDSVPARMDDTLRSSFWGLAGKSKIAELLIRVLKNRGYNPEDIEPIEWIQKLEGTRIYMVQGPRDQFIGYSEFSQYAEVENPNIELTVHRWEGSTIRHQTFRSRDLGPYASHMLAFFKNLDLPTDHNLVSEK